MIQKMLLLSAALLVASSLEAQTAEPPANRTVIQITFKDGCPVATRLVRSNQQRPLCAKPGMRDGQPTTVRLAGTFCVDEDDLPLDVWWYTRKPTFGTAPKFRIYDLAGTPIESRKITGSRWRNRQAAAFRIAAGNSGTFNYNIGNVPEAGEEACELDPRILITGRGMGSATTDSLNDDAPDTELKGNVAFGAAPEE